MASSGLGLHRSRKFLICFWLNRNAPLRRGLTERKTMDSKVCTKCGETKPLDEFNLMWGGTKNKRKQYDKGE